MIDPGANGRQFDDPADMQQRLRDAEVDALALVDAVSALSSKLTVDEVSQVACLHARKIARAKIARLIMVDGAGNLKLLKSSPGSIHPAKGTQQWAHTVGSAMRNKRPSVLRDGKRLTIYFPVRKEGKISGVLQLDYPAESPDLTQRAQRLCEAVATQCGVALERAERADELQRLAVTDPLTGLGNRRQLLHDLRREVVRAQRMQEPLSIVMLDIDNFKEFNDSRSHIEGDKLLHTFGRFLAKSLRGMDVAGRYGGEEFLLILPNTPIAGAQELLGRIRSDWATLSVVVTFSGGLASLHPKETAVDVVLRADIAMLRAKRAGRDRVMVSDEIHSPTSSS